MTRRRHRKGSGKCPLAGLWRSMVRGSENCADGYRERAPLVDTELPERNLVWQVVKYARDVLHDPPAWLQLIDESQEPIDEPQAFFDIAAATTIGKRELGARRTADQHVDCPYFLRVCRKDVAHQRSCVSVVLLVGHDGGRPVVHRGNDSEASLVEPLREPASTAEEVCDGQFHARLSLLLPSLARHGMSMNDRSDLRRSWSPLSSPDVTSRHEVSNEGVVQPEAHLRSAAATGSRDGVQSVPTMRPGVHHLRLPLAQWVTRFAAANACSAQLPVVVHLRQVGSGEPMEERASENAQPERCRFRPTLERDKEDVGDLSSQRA